MNTNFTKFHNFVFFSSTDFGPGAFGRKNGLRRVCTLNGWAEVSVSNTLNAHFGPVDTAEMGNLLPHTIGPKLCHVNHFLTILSCLHETLNFMGGFRPKKCSNQKTFGEVKVSKMIQRIEFACLEAFSGRFMVGRSQFLSTKKVKK